MRTSAEITESHVIGPDRPPLLEDTIPAALDRAAADWADRPALIVRHQHIHWTYAELAREVDALARALIDLGLIPGDRIGIWAPNCWEWVVTQFATAKAGLILVNINPAYRIAELEFAINKVGCRALILAHRFKSSDYVAMIRQLAPPPSDGGDPEHTSRLPSVEQFILVGEEPVPGFVSFGDLMERGRSLFSDSLEKTAAALSPSDPINIQFTSGTTGTPKGATLTHHNILNNGYFTGERQKLTSDDKVCIPVPLYHCFGMVLGNLACITHGAAMVYPAPSFDPKSVLEAVSEDRCTALYGVPTMFIAVLDHPEFDDFDVSSLRTGIMAGSPCPIEVMKRVVSDLHAPQMTIAYGMTETSPVSFQSATDDSLERRVSTVGRIHPHVEVKIVDETGEIVPCGMQGELLTRGYSVMRGYWNDAEKTAEAIDADGWMHTGDLGTLDDEGYCRITGRLKDMVIRGGENIYPREIEEFLYRHPAIQDVQIFGVPDPKFGEELACWVILREGKTLTAEELRDFCRGQIAHYKIPRYVCFVTEYPMTVTGKVQKFEMRKVMMEVFSLAEEETA